MTKAREVICPASIGRIAMKMITQDMVRVRVTFDASFDSF